MHPTGQETCYQIIRESMLKAKDERKKYANKRRREREFQEGDMVYLRIQPYRQTSLSLHGSLKLHSKYCGPYRVLIFLEKWLTGSCYHLGLNYTQCSMSVNSRRT
jgi:hypothetical protein